MKVTATEPEYTINDLPDEVIEFVLSFVPPYRDLHDCMQVCKRWRTSVLNVVRVRRRKLLRALSEFDVRWQCGETVESAPTIAKRYSHSAAVHDNSMYVFGGCTNSMTTFNDLWRLDLSSRRWVRPLASGNYPTPKACSSLVCYRDMLVLFGGWAYPCSYPFHQSYQLFSELHTYSIPDSRWSCVEAAGGAECPPPMAGHSVSVHGQHMVVFGGMQRADSAGPLVKTNDVWQLDLERLSWQLVAATAGPRPRERYGHSQTALDAEHALVMGGCGGPNGLFSDVWLLTLAGGGACSWRQVEVRNAAWAPPDTWCHPTCRVGEHIVVLNRARASVKSCWRPPGPPSGGAPPRERREEPRPLPPPPIRAVPVPAPAGLPPPPPAQHSLGLAAFGGAPPHRAPRAASAKNRERQLELLRKMENLIRTKREAGAVAANKARTAEPKRRAAPSRNALGLYLLELAGALQPQPWVAWVQPKADRPALGPEETLLYTLVRGKAELIMFGGIQKDNNGYNVLVGNLDPSNGLTKVSNSLHFIGAPVDVI